MQTKLGLSTKLMRFYYEINSPKTMCILVKKILWFSLIWFCFPLAQAELTIKITKSVETTVPIAVVPFASTTQIESTDIASIIVADLNRSGLFKLLDKGNMPEMPSQINDINLKKWRTLGQEYLVIGRINKISENYRVQFYLLDVYKGKSLLSHQIVFSPVKLRHTAHSISNLIYKKLTGRQGVFNTRIAYISSAVQTNRIKRFQLIITDIDGFNQKTIVSSTEPIMSPSWSFDRKKIAYVSLENGQSSIYLQTIATGQRTKIASYKGINGAPAFSPDGTRLAMTLSKDGSPDIYVLNLINKQLTKLTKSYAIDTEAAWSPDGKTIIYTSNRGGKPQLYSIPSTGGKSLRLTFEGDYNARGKYSINGKSIVMVHANNKDYRIATMELATKTLLVLSDGTQDESPSFSPNGDMLVYTSHEGKKGKLSIISIGGRIIQHIEFNDGEVRNPSWSH